jgi:DNA-binding transcriptional ArsR family regulator
MASRVTSTNRFLKAVSDEHRLGILLFLQDSPKCVCQIFPHLKISQKLASHHLAQLKKAGLVKQERDGNFNFYSLNPKNISENLKLLNSLLNQKNYGYKNFGHRMPQLQKAGGKCEGSVKPVE